MNPIYKTGWGQYVDLEKIVSIESSEIFINNLKSSPDAAATVQIYAQLIESPIRRNVSVVADQAQQRIRREDSDYRKFYRVDNGTQITDPEELKRLWAEQQAEQDIENTRAQAVLQGYISALIMAWESYRNR